MKRSAMLQILARRLSNREVDDIYEDALNEMEFVQRAVLEKLPNQPWFLQVDEQFGLPLGTDFIEMPADYNGLMTRGGVWFNEAELEFPDKLEGVLEQDSLLSASLTPIQPFT